MVEMDPGLRLQIELGINLLFVTVMTFFLVYIFVNSRRTRVQRCYCFLHTVVILLFIANFSVEIAPDIRSRWICIAATHIIKIHFDVLFIIYIRHIFKTRFRINFIIVMVVLYIITGTLLIVTNPVHHLFIREMTEQKTTFGILYYIIMGTGYCLLTIGMLLNIKTRIIKMDNLPYRIFSSVLALAGILFVHLSIMRISLLPFDIFPLLILACFTAYFIGGCKYGMFDIMSVGSRLGFEMFTDALLVIGRKGRVLYRNKACTLLEEKTLSYILAGFYSQSEAKPTRWKGSVSDLEIPEENGIRYLTVSIKPIRRGVFSSGKTILVIRDNTKINSAIRSLSEKNQYLEEMHESVKMLSEDARRLAVLSERNLMAKEIHDVMGHSLILALNTLESNKLLRTDSSAALKRIEQAVSEIGDSLKEIASTGYDESILPDPDEPLPKKVHHTMLAEKLRTLAVRLSGAGIVLETAAIDDLSDCEGKVLNAILRICQESITNAIKHGKASRIALSVKRKQDKIELLIVDNGRGSTGIIKGNGLTGMEERVKELQGNISFSSFEDQEGFMVRAVIPEAMSSGG